VTYGKSVVFSTNKIDRSDLAEILLKVALNTIKQANKNSTLVYTCVTFNF
jgi:hypothetical protein